MAQIEAKSWGPALAVPEGRCTVNLDESALRMLEPAQHRRNPAQPTYHSFKYNFKPESIDVRKPGKVQAANPPRVVQDGVALDVEQLGSNNDDKHLFTAVEQAPKELEVFMVFDPTTGEFTMFEADSVALLTYDRVASKAASRSRSRASPTTQPIAIPPVPAPPPKPTPTPITFPTAAEPAVPISAPTAPPPAKRTAVQKPKAKPKPKPKVPVKEPTPPPPPREDPEEGELELELEPVPIPSQEEETAMDVDEQGGGANGEMDLADANGILPWEAVPTTAHRRMGNSKSAFNATEGPDEEVFDFGGSFGAPTRDPPRKTQPKSGRSGGINFPKAGRARDPPPPRPPAPVEPDPEEDPEMDEVVPELPSNDFEDEMARQLGESSEEGEDDEDEEEEEEFGAELAQAMEAVTQDDSSDDDDDSSSEEDD